MNVPINCSDQAAFVFPFLFASLNVETLISCRNAVECKKRRLGTPTMNKICDSTLSSTFKALRSAISDVRAWYSFSNSCFDLVSSDSDILALNEAISALTLAISCSNFCNCSSFVTGSSFPASSFIFPANVTETSSLQFVPFTDLRQS